MKHKVYRFDHNGKIEWLFISRKQKQKTIPGRKFKNHGNLIDTEMGGGGYHGRCSNCGLALVTDLGYCSWDNTQCKTEDRVVVIEDEKIGWTKFEDRAKEFDKKTAHNYLNIIRDRQGWGEYNFSIKPW